MSGKSDLQFGEIDLLDDEALNPRKVKVRITTFVDEEVLRGLKAYAARHGNRYQSVLNAVLRAFVERQASGGGRQRALSEARVRRIVREELKKRA